LLEQQHQQHACIKLEWNRVVKEFYARREALGKVRLQLVESKHTLLDLWGALLSPQHPMAPIESPFSAPFHQLVEVSPSQHRSNLSPHTGQERGAEGDAGPRGRLRTLRSGCVLCMLGGEGVGVGVGWKRTCVCMCVCMYVCVCLCVCVCVCVFVSVMVRKTAH
jgi:hypothetical protein